MLTYNRILKTWWPLAASWMLMAAELPALSAVVARLPNPEINLAAYGGVVFPLALIIESPIIMLLSASTAVCKDWDSYRKVYRFMMVTSAVMTLIHVLIAFTPLYDVVVRGILGAPPEIIEPARLGLRIMLPWTWAIAYRRFHQGILIRFDHSKIVGVGTAIRLSSNLTILLIGYASGTLPGIAVATSAVIAGILCEALYVGIVVRPVLRTQVRLASPEGEALTMPAFYQFYIPLVLTSLIQLLIQPIGSAALSRMPLALESLAVWPVISGLTFMLRSLGIAYNEVVVALLDHPGSFDRLRRFTWILGTLTSLLLLAIAATPLASMWFTGFSGLSPILSQLASVSLWFSLISPGLAALQSWYQGTLLNTRRTRPITESVIAFMVISVSVLVLGVVWGKVPGVYLASAAFSLAMLAQTGWLAYRSRIQRSGLAERDARLEAVPAFSD